MVGFINFLGGVSVIAMFVFGIMSFIAWRKKTGKDKKLFKLFWVSVGAMVIFGVIGAIIAPDQPVVEDKVVAEQPKEEKEMKPEVAEEEPVVEKKEEEAKQPSQDDLLLDYQAYYYPKMMGFAQLMDDFSGHFSSLAENPLLTQDRQFYEDTGVLIGRLNASIEEMKGYEGKVPDKLASAHEQLLSTMDSYQVVADYMPEAIAPLAEGDASKLPQLNQYLTEANQELAEVNSELELAK